MARPEHPRPLRQLRRPRRSGPGRDGVSAQSSAGRPTSIMDMNVDVDPDWGASTAASDRGAGPLGFSGTVSKGSEQAAGLATLSDDGYGNGPSMPMLPNTWSPEGEETDG